MLFKGKPGLRAIQKYLQALSHQMYKRSAGTLASCELHVNFTKYNSEFSAIIPV